MILDLFAGPGGWDVGAKRLGLDPIGIEWEPNACATRAAAGHLTIRADVATIPTRPYRGLVGLIGSPPCQDFSTMTAPELRRGLKGKRGSLATQPLRFVDDLRPRWVALEEVPAVLPLWKLYRNVMADWGYSAWCGAVNAADFGVPQRRKRAVLLASRVGIVGGPVPTHTSDNAEALFGFDVPAVSMRNVLDLPIEYGHLFVHSAGQFGDYIASLDELSPTVAMGKNYNNWRWTVEPTLESWEIGRALTTAEVGLLQSFPVDYPWSGTRVSQFQQVSNAVPPLLAEKLLACVMASTYEAEADRQSDEAYAEYLAAMESEAQAGDPKW